jgi:hypothetical protein
MATEGKYGEITATGKKFHPGEPVWLFRSTDPFAPDALDDYAGRCDAAGCDSAHVQAAVDAAERMREWQFQNPDLVKQLPD